MSDTTDIQWAEIIDNLDDTIDAQKRTIAALTKILSGIQWRSDDKDNMEFAARITYVQMDAIRAAISAATGDGN